MLGQYRNAVSAQAIFSSFSFLVVHAVPCLDWTTENRAACTNQAALDIKQLQVGHAYKGVEVGTGFNSGA